MGNSNRADMRLSMRMFNTFAYPLRERIRIRVRGASWIRARESVWAALERRQRLPWSRVRDRRLPSERLTITRRAF